MIGTVIPDKVLEPLGHLGLVDLRSLLRDRQQGFPDLLQRIGRSALGLSGEILESGGNDVPPPVLRQFAPFVSAQCVFRTNVNTDSGIVNTNSGKSR